MANVETILVVGGGVAGLTTATALHRYGFATELVERQETWHALGAGFLVHANGMRMLAALGLAAGAPTVSRMSSSRAFVIRWKDASIVCAIALRSLVRASRSIWAR